MTELKEEIKEFEDSKRLKQAALSCIIAASLILTVKGGRR
jgi:hypothetical protein